MKNKTDLEDFKFMTLGRPRAMDYVPHGGVQYGLARFQEDESLDTSFRPLCDAWLVRPSLGIDGTILVVVVTYDDFVFVERNGEFQ